MLHGIRKKNKKGVSEMIGYILLIGLAVVMGGAMYVWMKSYVPTDKVTCPDGVSVIIKNYSYDCSLKTLNLTIANTGRFAIGGYYILASNDSSQNLATINLYKNLQQTSNGFQNIQENVIFNRNNNNSFDPNSQVIHFYNLNTVQGDIAFIEITPARYEKYNNRLMLASCGDATKTKEIIRCN